MHMASSFFLSSVNISKRSGIGIVYWILTRLGHISHSPFPLILYELEISFCVISLDSHDVKMFNIGKSLLTRNDYKGNKQITGQQLNSQVIEIVLH